MPRKNFVSWCNRYFIIYRRESIILYRKNAHLQNVKNILSLREIKNFNYFDEKIYRNKYMFTYLIKMFQICQVLFFLKHVYDKYMYIFKDIII